MNNIATTEIEKMKHLISFGVNENVSKSNNTPIVEFTQKGADGLNYAIVRECNKHYIMVAPKKNTEILAEDYDYLGGFNNRKGYDSYNVASKQFGLKMKNLNEAYAVETVVAAPFVESDWIINETKEMRKEIDRLKQISNIVEGKSDIKAYGETVGNVDTDWTVDDKKPNTYIEEPVGKSHVTPDKDWTNDDEKPSKKVEKTNDEVGSSHTSDTAQKSTGYTEKANLKKTDIKESRTIKLTEEQVLAWNRDNDDYMDKSNGTKIGHNGDPYTEKTACPICGGSDSKKACKQGVICNESEGPVHNTDKLYNNPGTGEVEDGEPYEKRIDENIFEIDTDDFDFDPMGNDDDAEMFDEFIYDDLDANDGKDRFGDDELSDEEIEDDDRIIDSLGGTDKIMDRAKNTIKLRSLEDKFGKIGLNENDIDGLEGIDDEETAFGADDVSGPMPVDDFVVDDDLDAEFDEEGNLVAGELSDEEMTVFENLVREAILSDFGKHPAFNKEPFTTPDTHEPAKKEWARRWDDETDLNNKMFGQEIGHNGDPYTEKVIDKLTEAILARMSQKKK